MHSHVGSDLDLNFPVQTSIQNMFRVTINIQRYSKLLFYVLVYARMLNQIMTLHGLIHPVFPL